MRKGPISQISRSFSLTSHCFSPQVIEIFDPKGPSLAPGLFSDSLLALDLEFPPVAHILPAITGLDLESDPEPLLRTGFEGPAAVIPLAIVVKGVGGRLHPTGRHAGCCVHCRLVDGSSPFPPAILALDNSFDRLAGGVTVDYTHCVLTGAEVYHWWSQAVTVEHTTHALLAGELEEHGSVCRQRHCHGLSGSGLVTGCGQVNFATGCDTALLVLVAVEDVVVALSRAIGVEHLLAIGGLWNK